MSGELACESDDSGHTVPLTPTLPPSTTSCDGSLCCGEQAHDMGSIRGDVGDDLIGASGTGLGVLHAIVSEGSGGDLFTDDDMSFVAQLEVEGDASARYRLMVERDCSGSEFGEKAGSGAAPIEVSSGWGGTLGKDDSRLVILRVEPLDDASAGVHWHLALGRVAADL